MILTVVANEHAVKGKISHQLQNLRLVEAYCNKFKSTGPTSCFRGRHHIDVVSYTHNVVPIPVSTCPFNFDVGDHRAYLVDFEVKRILGDLSLTL